ncbi:MAG: zinc ribbon domain-containing protein [Planctomycetota bacterium]
MPTYDYICDVCDYTAEEFQSMTAKVLRKCPACGKPKLRRLIGTGAGVIFKGGGFYETDYRSESYEKDAKADGLGEKSGGDNKESKPETPKAAEKPKKAEAKTAKEKPKPKKGGDG